MLSLFLPHWGGNAPVCAAETVRVGVYQNEPLILIDDQGGAQGFAVEVLRAVADQEGWALHFVPGTWAECLQRLAQGRIDLLPAVAKAGDRSRRFTFNEVPLLANWGRLFSSTETTLESILDLDGKTVSLLQDDIHALVFRKLAADFDIRIEPLWVGDYADVLRTVEEGRAAAGVVNRLYGLRQAAKFGVAPTPIMFNPVQVHFAAPHEQNNRLLIPLDRHLRIFKADEDSVYFTALNRWLGAPQGTDEIPAWIKLAGALLTGALMLALAFILVLRWQVRARTERLKSHVDKCEAMRDQLGRREALFRELFNHISSGVAIYEAVGNGRDYVFKDINPAGERLGQTQREDLLGKSVAEVFPGADTIGLIAALQRVDRSGRPEELPVALYEDERLQLYVKNYLCKLPSGELIAVFDDITGRKRYEKALEDSLERYEKLFQAHRSVILLIDPANGALIDANPAACEFYGYDRDELLTQRITDINQLPKDEILRCMQQAVERDKQDYRFRHRLKNGAIRAVDVSTSKIHLEGRTLLCSIIHDVTDRLEIEEKLIHASEEWSSTFDAIPDLIIILDKDRRILRVNKAAAEFAGKDFREIAGKYCHDVFTDNREPCPLCPAIEVTRTGQAHTEVMDYPFRGIVFQKTCAPIFDSEGNIEKFVVAAKDVTEKRHLEEQLLQAQKMEAVGTLAGGVAHDFNNILSAIIGFAEIAKLELPQGSKAITDIEEVLQASRRAAELIKQILTFSRKDSAAKEVFQPHLVIKESLKMLRSSMPSTISIVEEIDPESGYIRASVTRLQQMVMNLCTNAIHALPNEKGTLKIGLHREDLAAPDISEPDIQPGPFIVLTVADNGSGMPPEVVERIFEPYFTTKTVERGTGLGLAVVHGIVAGNGGFIRVDSRPGAGSTFRVYLPAAPPPLQAQQPKIDTDVPPGGDEHILVVDDEPAILEINRSMLQNLGYKVTIARDAAQALALLEKEANDFDLIITDQTMPDMTGSELTQRVLLLRPGLPVILCSGYSALISEEEARKIGIRAFLMKPVDYKILARAVRTALDL